MEITGTASSALASESLVKANSAKQLSDDFLQLLVAQLKNQDPLEPVKNEQFVTELAQLQSLDTQLAIEESNRGLLLQSSLATGASLIGGKITGLVQNGGSTEEISGILQSVKVADGSALYQVLSEDGVVHQMSPFNLLEISSI